MTHETARELAAYGGLIYFAGLFVLALVYAFSPRNRETFDRAARLPLIEDDRDD